MLEQDTEIYQLTLNIKQIKLTVKFPCKLTLNYLNKIVKSDVSLTQNGKYLIDKQLKTKSENAQPVEILIHLTTEKGGNIIAGIIKLNPKDLSHSEGQILTLPLQKCLDLNANCLLKIDKVWVTRNSKTKSMAGQMSSRNRKVYGDDLIGSSKKVPTTVVDSYRNVETRSQFPGFNIKNSTGLKGFEGISQTNKLYGLGPKSYVPQMQMAKSKNLDRSMDLRKQGLNKFRIQDDNKTIGKREIDPSYRLTVQANEKNLKMDIMKYKMKAEEQQKTIDEKNKQIKGLKEEISQLQRQSVEKNFYQEEINSKNHNIQKLQDTVKQLNKENNRLQSRVIELERAQQENKSNLASSLQRVKDEKERREIQLGKQLTLKKDEISLLNDELKSKNNQISRLKKIIEDLQNAQESKTFDYERAIQGERSQMVKLQTLLNDKIKQLQQINKSTSVENDSLHTQLRKKTQQLQKIQVHTNQLMVEIKQITELQKYYAPYKGKFLDLEKAYQKLDEQKKEVEKHYLKLMEMKEKDVGEFREEQSGLINSYKKKNAELTDKTKQQTTKISELQTKTTILVTDIDKLKRILQLSQKQLLSVTQNCKSLSQSLKQKDQLLLSRQKQLSQLQSTLFTRESLMKKDIEYKTEQLSKVSAKVSELEQFYRHEKENNQTLRFEATKIQGKNKLQEEINSRLNRQIEELKNTAEKREAQYKEDLKQLNQKIKTYDQTERKLNKQITQYEMLDINRKNDINRLNKDLEVRNEKIERLTKKIQQQQQFTKELNETKAKNEERIAIIERQLNELQNNKRVLEADFSKTQKIKTIIVQEKTSVQNELANLKKQIDNKIALEQSLNKEIRDLKEEITRMTLKLNNVTKDFQSFKENLYQTIQTAFYSPTGSTVNKSFNFTIDTNHKDSPSRNQRRYTSSSNINMNESLSMKSGFKKVNGSELVNGSQQNSFSYEPRFNEIIESYGRESQQTVMALNDSIRKYKVQIERLERQSANLSARLQSSERQSVTTISSLEHQLQQLRTKSQQSIEEWEEKLMLSQRGSRQKQKVIEELNDECESLHHQLAGQSRTHEMQLQELFLKIEQLKRRNEDLEGKNDFCSMTILGYQQKIFTLQSTISQLSEQLEFLNKKIQRKDKLIIEHTSRIQELNKLLQQTKIQRLQLNRQLLATKQKLQAERQNNQNSKRLLSQEEEKNKEIKVFNNDLLKQKESIVKNQLIKSEKVIELEDIICRIRIQKEELITESENKDKVISELKVQIKRNLLRIKQMQDLIQKGEVDLNKSIQMIREGQKCVQEKQVQIKSQQINLQKIMTRYEHEIKRLNQEQQQITNKHNKELEQKKTKILELSNQVQKLSHLEKKLSQQNISLEEQIFFEKQTASLVSTQLQNLSNDIEDRQAKLSQAIQDIQTLNQQVRDRQEKLFQLSNKLYAQDTKLQIKNLEITQKLQQLNQDWKNKYEETLEDYQAKIQSYQREKIYLKAKLDENQQEIIKLETQKRALLLQEERNNKSQQEKLKKIETDRLTLLVEKNKQIEKLKQQLQTIQDTQKQTKHQNDLKDDQIRRLEEKVTDREEKLIAQEEKAQQSLTHLEKELQFQKKKESQLKRYKEFIKNNLWSSQREIKRILQSYVKNLMTLCQEERKKEVIDIMKTVEGQVVKAIEFSLEEA